MRNQERTRNSRRPANGRTRIAFATPVAAVFLTFLMMAPPVSAAPTRTLSAPYSGVVTSTGFARLHGCARASITQSWSGSLLTGTVTGRDRGRAVVCNSHHSAESGDEADISFVLPLKGTLSSIGRVWVNVSAVAKLSLNASNGLPSGQWACTARYSRSTEHEVVYRWNYSATSRTFGSTFRVDDFKERGVWSNYSHGSTPPNPFPHNNTTSYFRYDEGTGSRFCSTESYAILGAYPEIVDLSTGADFNPSGANFSMPNGVYGANIGVVNQTDWACLSDTYWDGPKNLSRTVPLHCGSSNRTESFIDQTRSPMYRNGTNGTQAWSSRVLVSGSIWFNSTAAAPLFVRGDRYELVVDFSPVGWTISNWAHGSGSWRVDLWGPGLGFRLTSIALR